jgi:hypothetical protein
MTTKFKPRIKEPIDADSEFRGLLLVVTEKGS